VEQALVTSQVEHTEQMAQLRELAIPQLLILTLTLLTILHLTQLAEKVLILTVRVQAIQFLTFRHTLMSTT
jgi:hypothetical protein